MFWLLLVRSLFVKRQAESERQSEKDKKSCCSRDHIPPLVVVVFVMAVYLADLCNGATVSQSVRSSQLWHLAKTVRWRLLLRAMGRDAVACCWRWWWWLSPSSLGSRDDKAEDRWWLGGYRIQQEMLQRQHELINYGMSARVVAKKTWHNSENVLVDHAMTMREGIWGGGEGELIAAQDLIPAIEIFSLLPSEREIYRIHWMGSLVTENSNWISTEEQPSKASWDDKATT